MDNPGALVDHLDPESIRGPGNRAMATVPVVRLNVHQGGERSHGDERIGAPAPQGHSAQGVMLTALRRRPPAGRVVLPKATLRRALRARGAVQTNPGCSLRSRPPQSIVAGYAAWSTLAGQPLVS